MKVALYKNVKYGFETASGEGFENGEYARVSEFADIEFIPLPYGESEKMQIAIIDKEIKSVMANSEQAINVLEQRKAELLALPGAE